MNVDIVETLDDLFQRSVEQFAERDALAFVGQKPISYAEMGQRRDALIAMLERLKCRPESKIAILSNNMPNWGIAYMAISGMRAIAVPLLPDFSETEIENILTHSETEVLFLSHSMQKKFDSLSAATKNQIRFVIGLDDFQIIRTDNNKQKFFHTLSYDKEDLPEKNYTPKKNDLAAIIYTSGTTGRSKGVMLTHDNLTFDTIQANKVEKLNPDDRFLSILPLSHTYENTIGFLLPMLNGASVHYLDKLPSPSILIKAMQQIKPTVILSVPLVIEKIYRNQILPALDKTPIRYFKHIPAIRKLLHYFAGKKMLKTFGGKLRFFGIGGSKLDIAVEKFLREASFPYAIGYGLTETAPLIAGSNPNNSVLQSTGPIIDNIEVRIDQTDPLSGEGEIQIRGRNVMQGYYKEDALSREVISEEGWFHTGDLGLIDQKGNLFIKGRLKNMILGPGGENIYPEEIESVINNFRHVVESLVLEKRGKLVALVHVNMEELEKQVHHLQEEAIHYLEQKLEQLREDLHNYVNRHVSRFSRIQEIILHKDPFEKTATHKIKRYLYI